MDWLQEIFKQALIAAENAQACIIIKKGFGFTGKIEINCLEGGITNMNITPSLKAAKK